MEVISAENGIKKPLPAPAMSKNQYRLKTFQASLNLVVHILIGIVVGANLIYSFRSGLPVGSTPKHIVLCVLGYQLLMAESILSLSPHNTWSTHLRLVDRKRAHWILQILGSALAITGSIIKSMDKSSNWTSLHGKFALVALVFTTISLVNGVASLWANEIRRVIPIPGKLSKVTHICFGVIAFAAANVTLCYGFNKNSVRNYFGYAVTDTLIAFSIILTVIIIVNPCISFVKRIISK